jgi:hypothetical protein
MMEDIPWVVDCYSAGQEAKTKANGSDFELDEYSPHPNTRGPF